jgi:sugar lactone lactonase YvrE
VALVDGFHLLDFDTGALSFLVGQDAVAGTRLNDGKVGPDGRFWAGTMDEELLARPIAALYRLDPDHSLHRVIEGLIVSNGWPGPPTAP